MVAHRKVNMQDVGIDYLAFSAHKVYAPSGTGALIVRKGLPGFSSAETELIRSSGEENPGGIAALGKALNLLQRIGLDLIREEVWLKLQVKNELIEINREKKNSKEYRKYDYENPLVAEP